MKNYDSNQAKVHRGKTPGKKESVWENVREKFGILLTYSYLCIRFHYLRQKTMPEYDIALELARLHILRGADFVRQLKMLTGLYIFKPVENEKDIFAAEGSHKEDMPSLVDAARKAVAHGNKVYILPNPKGIRTADFIFENKGVYKMYDLKTIQGKASVMNRLLESVGQTTHVLLNMTTDYRAISLACSSKKYFEINPNAMEVLVFKGNKSILLKRTSVDSRDFFKTFVKRYNK